MSALALQYPAAPPPVGCDEKSLQSIMDLDLSDMSDEMVNKVSEILHLDFIFENQVVEKSSPGAPWIKLGASNEDIIDNYKPLLKRVIVERLVFMLYNDLEEESALDLLHLGLADPVKLFVKNEPHAQRKLVEGRLRLISSVSICWNTISRLLYGRQNRLEKHNWSKGVIPSMCGMGSSDEDLRTLKGYWDSQGFDNLAEADVSGWDWSIQAWELEADVERRIEASGRGPLLARLMRNTHYVMARKVFMLSNGTLLAQESTGVLPSGWYCTTTTNSYIRALAAHLVGARFYKVLGDDSVESFVEGAVERYEDLGHDVKFYRRCTEAVEFCSRRWSRESWTAPLVTWPRTFYRLLCQQPSLDFVRQFKLEMRYNPETSLCMEVLQSVGWSRQICQDSFQDDPKQEEDFKQRTADRSAAEGSVQQG